MSAVPGWGGPALKAGWISYLRGGNHFLLVGDLDSHVSTLAPHCFPLGTTSCSLRLEEESSTTRAPSAG